jgi:hypothetical protein
MTLVAPRLKQSPRPPCRPPRWAARAVNHSVAPLLPALLISVLPAAASARVRAKPVMLWAATGLPLASRAQRRHWIGGVDHQPVAGLVGGWRGGVQGGIRGGGLGRLFYCASPRLPWRGPRQLTDGLAMRPAAGVTPMAVDPASTAARSCFVVAGG